MRPLEGYARRAAWIQRRPLRTVMSAFDPKRTLQTAGAVYLKHVKVVRCFPAEAECPRLILNGKFPESLRHNVQQLEPRSMPLHDLEIVCQIRRQCLERALQSHQLQCGGHRI